MSEVAGKSKNQEKNEAKRLAKLIKFNAKIAKQTADGLGAKSKPKIDKIVSELDMKHEIKFVNTTPKGHKKDLSGIFPASFQPKAVEAAWYDWWEHEGYFKPKLNEDESVGDAGNYVIAIPPPNVTGTLHLGHALTNSIEDVMIRWNRMRGKSVLWVPGADHAGIATQIVVEKKLMRERGVTRHQLGRDKFLEETFKWKDQYIDKIYNQIRRLGASVDWDRAQFTMDSAMSVAVNEAFVRLHQDGTIYRANRLVNWCTKLKTALSNLEVENLELEGRTLLSVPDHDPSKKYEFGVMISFAYQVENSEEKIVVATTRLETMLGDTAIAVHPTDKRYKHLHGKFVVHPFNGRRIPIIADEYPDPDFGTGAVKITPAHDQNDFIVGKRNNLDFINVFSDDGKINDSGAPFIGLQRFDARIAVLEALKAKGLYVGTADNKMIIPICGRSQNIIEPLLKPQWWVNCTEMAGQAVDAVRNGDLSILPAASEKEWFRWLEQPQDWCISRQLWWGHRVPAYYVIIQGDSNDRSDDIRWVSGRNAEEALANALSKFKDISKDMISIEQDEDVLDTWFSSGLWPFATMGWPNNTQDLKNFFPNSLLETGWDILFFWVARMVMMSLKLTGKVPFPKVFCHAMIRDAHGRKMSKSLGNVIDPIDVIEGITLADLQLRLEQGNLDPKEIVRAQAGQAKDFPLGIPECGTDALRFTLLAYPSFGRDINLDILRVDGYRKFCNKIWNATRFALIKLDSGFKPFDSHVLSGKESVADLWILHKLNNTIKETNEYLDQMNFMQATNSVYQFWWTELCDVYLEVCKPVIDGSDIYAKVAAQNVLYTCLDQGLKLLHPFMPFVTEELYQRLPRRVGDTCPSIMISEFPIVQECWQNHQAEKDFEYVNAIVHAARSLITDYNVRNGTIYVQSANQSQLLDSQKDIAKTLIRGCKDLFILQSGVSAPSGCSLYTIEDTKIYLLVKGMIDIEQELIKLTSKQDKINKLCGDIIKRQSTEGYAMNVKEEIKTLDINRLVGYELEINAINASICNFSKLLIE